LGVLTVDEAHEKISEMVSEGATAAKRRIARER
jgi:hypothetical protein